MTKKNNYEINIGTSSLLLIFIIISLVSFASLSLVTALNDRRLTIKLKDKNDSYYQASNLAEEAIANEDNKIRELLSTDLSEEEFTSAYPNPISMNFPISKLQSLLVEIEPLYSKNDNAARYRIARWEVLVTDNFELDESLPVFGK